MLYAILCYHDEDVVGSWTKEEDDAVMAKLAVVQEKLAKQGRLGPVARLMPTTAATTLRKDASRRWCIDGPFAETKEQLLGFYVVDCDILDEALEIARELGAANPGGAYEIRPVGLFAPGKHRHDRDRHRLDRRGADRRRGRRRSARCCAISAISTRPRRRSRKPACGR